MIRALSLVLMDGPTLLQREQLAQSRFKRLKLFHERCIYLPKRQCMEHGSMSFWSWAPAATMQE